jgi:hypothetical protein
LIKWYMALMRGIAIVVWPRVAPSRALSPVTVAALLVLFRGRKRCRKLTGHSCQIESQNQDSRTKVVCGKKASQ